MYKYVSMCVVSNGWIVNCELLLSECDLLTNKNNANVHAMTMATSVGEREACHHHIDIFINSPWFATIVAMLLLQQLSVLLLLLMLRLHYNCQRENFLSNIKQ